VHNRFFRGIVGFLLLILPCCNQSSEVNSGTYTDIPSPPQNPISIQGVEFGKALFQSNLLSSDGKSSCQSCHHPDTAFSGTILQKDSDPDFSRQIPSLLNLAWSKRLFWDGREENLESLVLKPVQNKHEMNLNLDSMIQSINQDVQLKQLCSNAFGVDSIGTVHVARALSQYIRTLVKLPDSAPSEGKKLFNTNCSGCHSGKTFSDFELRKSVLAASGKDSGYYRLTHKMEDVFVFKTPGLAGISQTAPYMHDGRFPDLESVLTSYAMKLHSEDLKQKKNRIEILKFLKQL